MGLTRPGGPAAGLGEDFAIGVADVPAKPEPAEPGRDLPAEIMRQICAHLRRSSPRRRCAPPSSWPSTPAAAPKRSATWHFDCLARDDDGAAGAGL